MYNTGNFYHVGRFRVKSIKEKCLEEYASDMNVTHSCLKPPTALKLTLKNIQWELYTG